MKSLISLIILTALCSVTTIENVCAQDLHIYVAAHPDDWQLFMNPNAYHSLKNQENKVIFLHTTAGDAGHGLGNNNYAMAREEGSLRAIRFMVNAISEKKGLGINMNLEKVVINDHSIQKFTYGNAIVYFFRLPDGNLSGPGYPLHNHSSLERLYKGKTATMSSIDSSTIYKSLDDLKTTIKALIRLENNNKGLIQFNLAETDSLINPNDHSDHRFSSHIMQDIAKDIDVVSIRLYEEYATSSKTQNVFEADFILSAGTWGATASGLSDFGHYSTWDKWHNAWIGRQYFREIKRSKN